MVALVILTAGAASLAAFDDSKRGYTRAEVRRMMKQARTAEEYQRLAETFRIEEQKYRREAEKMDAVHRKHWTSVRLKVPTTAENARSWRDHYTRKAEQAGRLAALYEQLFIASAGARPLPETPRPDKGARDGQ